MGKTVARVFAFLIGWLFLTGLLTVVYRFSRWASAYIGFGEEPLIIGLIGTIAFAWCYTHSEIKEDLNRMGDRVERLERELLR